ncbi:alpha/beta hydrolase [Kitasatospora sp. NPDC002227]|uniref:alpha/beta hydrolase n=1 Tax=Kitasatospora sp. NPDC002227 TaxID=3154773 RepID=UPI00331CD278
MSQLDLATLRDSDFTTLYPLAEACDTLYRSFAEHADTWHSSVDTRVQASGWQGAAGTNAARSIGTTTARLRAAEGELGMIGQVLRNAADALLLAQSRLQQALAEAATAGLEVGPDGTVTAPAHTAADRHDPDVRATVQSLAEVIGAALAEAAEADQATADQLRHYTANAHQGTAGLTLQQTATDRLAVSSATPDLLRRAVPGPDAAPADVHTWWASLTTVEQQRLLRTHPELLGPLDGLPAAARDQANRANLTHLIADYRRRSRRSPDEQAKLDGFLALERRLADCAGSRPPALLLAVGDEGQGRAVLSWGDPDTARHVSAYVPGLGTTLAAIGGRDADRAYHLWQAAQRTDPGSPTASLVWLGYDPPPGLDRLAKRDLRPAEVLSDVRAEHGAPAYARFLAGLRAGHQGPQPAHVTALGHSYGSTTVGLAAQLPGGIAADELVLVGSPGTGADSVSRFTTAPGHVWVGDAENDPVSHLPSTGDGAARVIGGPLGTALFHAVADDRGQLYFGADPAGEAFGARRFRVADGPPGSFASHSDYLDDPAEPGTRESVDNIARIVTGHYEAVTEQARRSP